MLDQPIWWFSFFMARCERIARSVHAWKKKKAEDKRVAAAIWNAMLADATVSRPNLRGKRQRAVREGRQNLNGGESPTSFSSPTSSPVASVCWTTTLSLKMTIMGWGEFTNKTSGNVDSCSECAWRIPVFRSLVLRSGSLLPRQRQDPRCDCRALRATDSLFAA